jgi:hypothetical protein
MYVDLVTKLVEKNKDYSSVKVAITEVAARCGVSEKEVKDNLKAHNSPYHHQISGYINGKPISRINLIHKFRKVMGKIIKQIESNLGYELSEEEILYVVEMVEMKLYETT